jgi:cation diffusion facilitator CzcD-associated flavoprotein CzcO
LFVLALLICFIFVSDNWRLRYKSLSLHDPIWANHLAYLPFPPNVRPVFSTICPFVLILFQWPIFTPSGKLANWFETYADVLELNVWCSSTLVPTETDFNEITRKWNVTIVRGDGSKRKFAVGHVVLATGLGGGYPKMPKPFKGQETFTGKIVHSSKHGSGAEWKGKQALVVGSCTSAHDVSVPLPL